MVILKNKIKYIIAVNISKAMDYNDFAQNECLGENK